MNEQFRQHYKPVVLKTQTPKIEKIADYSTAIVIGLIIFGLLTWQLCK
jgi:hypothetical protein